MSMHSAVAAVRISAVIPSYNRATTLARALDSVLAQALAPLEIIVVDDGSTDDTRSIVESYGQCVRYVHQANAGVASARNSGALAARGDWIAFLDSDDFWRPAHLARIAAAIVATEGRAGCYFSDVQVCDPPSGSRYWDACGFAIAGAYLVKQDPSDWVFMRTQPMLLQASCIDRGFYFDVGGLPHGMKTREDTLLFYRMAFRRPMCAVRHCGTVMMDDGPARLTCVLDAAQLQYHEATLQIFRELTRDDVFPDVAARAAVRVRLAKAHLDLARAYWRGGRVGQAASAFVCGAMTSPSETAGFMRSKVQALGGRRLREFAR